MSSLHEAAIRQATPKALLPPGEETPEPEPVIAVPEKSPKGSKGKAAGAAVARRGSKEDPKPAVQVMVGGEAQPGRLGRGLVV